MHVFIPVSPSELIDKITILEIKLVEIQDELKRANIRAEHELLVKTLSEVVTLSDGVLALKEELRVINKSIWDSENLVREYWGDDTRFLEGARSSHYMNDERARVKRAINELFGSSIIEEKSHPTYERKE